MDVVHRSCPWHAGEKINDYFIKETFILYLAFDRPRVAWIFCRLGEPKSHLGKLEALLE